MLDGNECNKQGNYYTQQGSDKYEIKHESAEDSESCQEKCQTTPECEYWSYKKPKTCHLLREGIVHDYCQPGECFRGPRTCDKCEAGYYYALSSDDASLTCEGIFG